MLKKLYSLQIMVNSCLTKLYEQMLSLQVSNHLSTSKNYCVGQSDIFNSFFVLISTEFYNFA